MNSSEKTVEIATENAYTSPYGIKTQECTSQKIIETIYVLTNRSIGQELCVKEKNSKNSIPRGK